MSQPVRTPALEDATVVFLRDGRLLSGSSDGTVRAWRLADVDPRAELEKRVRLCLQPDKRQRLFLETTAEAEAAHRRCQRRLGLAQVTMPRE